MTGRFRVLSQGMQRNWVAIFLVAAGVAMIAVGVFHGEMNSVFQKAKSICLECIGIG